MQGSSQKELEEILSHASAHSLDVERKHAHDKKSEAVKVLSVASGSRNSILQRYQLQRAKRIAETICAKKAAKKQLYFNKWSLARKEKPELFKQGRGKLHWERGVSDELMQQPTQLGDPEALDEYMQEHGARLSGQAALLRENAKQIMAGVGGPIPMNKAEWLEWLDNHEDEFRDHPRNATSRRKVFSL